MDASSVLTIFIAGVLPLALIGYFLGRKRAHADNFEGRRFHSPSGYYGWYSLLWISVPSLVLTTIAFFLQLFGVVHVPFTAFAGVVGVLALAGLAFSQKRISPELRARNAVERVVMWVLVISSIISILTTLGIVLSVLFEALVFFKQVSLWDFLTGTKWNPDVAFLQGAGRGGETAIKPEFGALPLFAGTFLITAIAMVVSLPMGLFAAIYMSEYASTTMRRVSKPALEVLAGIPTVVYGFFAAITVSPLIVNAAESMGLNADYTNALAPGLVMGVMIIPLVSSLSDDVINAVPQSMREGSYALGATPSETIKRVLLPAALPGVVAAFILAFSRAVGETMIVVMAAGLRPNMTLNPLEGMTTVTVRIVDALVGDQEFDSLETLSAFALGLVLLVMTLILNVISAYIIRRFRQKYE